jgi:hypothetical protein
MRNRYSKNSTMHNDASGEKKSTDKYIKIHITMAYRYTRLAKSLSFTGVANYQGMSRHMDMRTLRIQSAEALPEAP